MTSKLVILYGLIFATIFCALYGIFYTTPVYQSSQAIPFANLMHHTGNVSDPCPAYKPSLNPKLLEPDSSNCVLLSMSSAALPLTALASVKGSGNTWTRHIIQQITGIHVCTFIYKCSCYTMLIHRIKAKSISIVCF